MKRLFLNYYLLIIVILVLARFVVMPLIESLGTAPFRQQFTHYYQELTKGPYYVVSQYLQQYPQNQWQQRLADLQPQFGYPLALVELTGAGLSVKDYHQLQEGRIVVGASYDTFWQRIGDSEQVLIMGPFPSPDVGSGVNIYLWGLIMVLLSVVVLLWVLPFWRKLKQISASAAAFGEGNFSVRAKVVRRSALAPLAEAFNRMADRIQQLINSQKQLTNAVSHELRTPLSRLRFGMEMLVKTRDDDNKERYVKGIYRDLDEMDKLVTELLTYARFEAKNFILRRKDVDLAPWLETTVQELAGEVEGKVWVECNLEQSSLLIDPDLLYRALSNLIHNGAKYGGGKVRVVLVKDDQHLYIHVDDDGPGITPEERSRIFEPFARLESSRSRETGGYGLGLAIVKQIASLHRGTVTVGESDLGGSRFSIVIPR